MIPYKITFKGFQSSESVWIAVQNRVEKLESLYDRITHCDVILSRNLKQRRGSQVYKVQVHIFIPGREIMIDHDSPKNDRHRTLAVTIRDAFDSAELVLEKNIQLLRHNIKHHIPKTAAGNIYDNGA